MWCDERVPDLDRSRLPIDVRRDPARSVRPPAGAPNVLVVVVDDMGFGASSAYGGPCAMPTAERLADAGLRYSRFHVTALCSPTRQALMTGRNHHSVGMGVTSEMATSEPGYTGYRPASAATIAQILGGNGYSTGRVRQVAPDAAGGGERLRALHAVARPVRASTGSTASWARR